MTREDQPEQTSFVGWSMAHYHEIPF